MTLRYNKTGKWALFGTQPFCDKRSISGLTDSFEMPDGPGSQANAGRSGNANPRLANIKLKRRLSEEIMTFSYVRAEAVAKRLQSRSPVTPFTSMFRPAVGCRSWPRRRTATPDRAPANRDARAEAADTALGNSTTRRSRTPTVDWFYARLRHSST